MGNLEVKKGERESLRGLLLERIQKRPLSQLYLGVNELTNTKVDFEPRRESQRAHTNSVWNYRKSKTFSSKLWTFGISNLSDSSQKYHFN
ncbi:hypothetical protein TNCV_3909811 [Trichonephila clavipes]|nr:hypothetical protein TNCV_3909811 [Trichonephila clavipes]